MWKNTLAVLALLATSPALQAAPLNFYLGGSFGDSVDLRANDLDLGLPNLAADASDRTWKVFGGIGIGRILGVEAAWHDFGTVRCCEGLADAGFDVDVKGYSVAAVAGIPISRLRLFAKAGLFSWKVDGSLESIAGPFPYSANGEDPMGGVGADLKLTRHLAVRAEWEIFKVSKGELNVASVGAAYRF